VEQSIAVFYMVPVGVLLGDQSPRFPQPELPAACLIFQIPLELFLLRFISKQPVRRWQLLRGSNLFNKA
jgi:hypothetical protein